ncbi:MAG TPA: UDP-N-acetylmuramate--L-alanine ligase [Erysipelothrix sp.]
MTNKTIYFIGIKGTGMAALARICHNLGYHVYGSDLTEHFFTEDPLRELGIEILPFSKDNIPNNATIIRGNAFKDDHVEVAAALKNPTIKLYSYHEFLGLLMKEYRSIAVSGSHGKTTTTTLLNDMMSYSQSTGYLIGDGQGELDEKDQYFLVEACEFRRHFLAYHPEVAIMTNFEIDHVDYFKDEQDYLSAFEAFSENVKELTIVWGDDPHLSQMNLSGAVMTYGLSKGNDLYAINIDRRVDRSIFDVYYQGEKFHHFNIPLVGDHMILNALAVIGVGIHEGINPHLIEAGLQNFKGAKRRFVIEEGQHNVYIDDYAHHPTEIDVTLKAVKQRYPDRRIVAIFKPHRTGRVHYFVDEFAKSLSQADEVFLCPFTSIDDHDDGVDIEIDYLQARIEGSYIIDEDQASIETLASFGPAVYVFMSSKDIYNIAEELKHFFND